MKLRVATYNIHKGVTSFRRRSRLHELRLALHRLDADLIFLQEVQERVAPPGRPQALSGALDFLASSGYGHRAYGANAFYPKGHHGNAILSRHPLGRQQNHDVSDHALESRGVLHAVVHVATHGAAGPEAQGTDIHLLCTHFGLARASRERQARWVCEFVEREIPRDAPLLLAGDFNDWQHAVDRHIRRLGLAEVFDAQPSEPPRSFVLHRKAGAPARTFPSFAPWFALDRIYVRGLRTLRARVLHGAAWARCSDHAPLVAELEFEPAGRA